MNRIGLAALAVALGGLLAAALPAAAQDDHLQCFKVKDDLKIKGTVDIDSEQFGLDSSCKINKAKLFCVPAAKSGVDAVDKSSKDEQLVPLDVRPPVFSGLAPGEEPLGAGVDRLCYKVKCDKSDIVPPQVVDQFGVHQLEVKKSFLLCTPALKGAVPVTEDVPCSEGFEDRWEFDVSEGDDVRVWANTIDSSTAADLQINNISCPDLETPTSADDDFPCTFAPPEYQCPQARFVAPADGPCFVDVSVASDSCQDPEIADYTLGVQINSISVQPTLVLDDSD